MSRKIVICAIILLLVLQGVLAEADDGVADLGGPQSQASLDSQNRYLAAEVSRQMKTTKEDIIVAINDYNDENFQVFDRRMNVLMLDTRMKVILGGIGAVLVANAIAAMILIKSWKRYSYEAYLEALLKKQAEEVKSVEDAESDQHEQSQLQQMQQSEWAPQQPVQTIGMQYGQAQASDMSYVNQWQTQPAYAGAWKSPVETEIEPSNTWQQAQQYQPQPQPQPQQQYQDDQNQGWNNG